jgi:monoamine oxidase
VLSDTGPVEEVYDSSPPSGKPGVLVGFLLADNARRWTGLSEPDRRLAVIDALARYFGVRARHPVGYHEKIWSLDTWATGCYGTVFPPGALTTAGPHLSHDWGRIHFAGADLAPIWPGHMEGAVRSAEHAAAPAYP